MKRISSFLAGVGSTILVASITIGALALSGKVSFNPVNVSLNGKQVGKAGETYTTSSGTEVPYSIVYTDEKGGGTTYLPVRKVSELLNIKINWNQEENTVEIGETPTDTDVNVSIVDPNAGKLEQEEANKKMQAKVGCTLQAFGGMFVVDYAQLDDGYTCVYNGNLSIEEFNQYWSGLSDEYINEQVKFLTTEMRDEYYLNDDTHTSVCLMYIDENEDKGALIGYIFVHKTMETHAMFDRPLVIKERL